MSEFGACRALAGGRLGGEGRRHRTSRSAVGCESLEGRELLATHALAGLAIPRHVAIPVVHRVTPVGHRVTPVLHRVTPVGHRVTPVRSVLAPHRGLATVSAPTSSTSSAVKQADQTLTSDLNAIAVRDNLPPAQVARFQADVKADQGAVTQQASVGAIIALQADYASEALLGSLDLPTLESDATVVLASAGIPQNLIARTNTDLQPLVTAPGLTLGDAALIDTDLLAIATASGMGI